MSTPLDNMNRILITIEEELAKGEDANLKVIAEASQTFHLNISRSNWTGIRLEIKNQFMGRWLELDEQVKALTSRGSAAYQEEQLCLAI